MPWQELRHLANHSSPGANFLEKAALVNAHKAIIRCVMRDGFSIVWIQIQADDAPDVQV
jgi:hypothetical protein